jgi:ParB-like nuclease domain
MTNLGAKGFNPKKGSMPVLQWMPPKMLAVDPAYQRSIDNTQSKQLINRIAKDWDWDLCQPLVVSRRDDNQLYVVDGQHRLAAAIARNDIEQLPCFICSLPDIAAEADRFVQFNRNRKALKPLDLWKAAVASGDANALQIVAALDAAGLKVAPTSNNIIGTDQLTNIGGLQRCLKEQGFDQLTAVLDVLGTAFRGETMQYGGTIFTGIAAIIADECRETDPKAWLSSHRAGLLVECLQTKTQAKWFNRVQVTLANSGGVRKQVNERVFREVWAAHQGKAVEAAKPAAMPVPRITETIDVPRKVAPAAPLGPPTAPKAGSLDPLAKAIIEKHGIAVPAKAKA